MPLTNFRITCALLSRENLILLHTDKKGAYHLCSVIILFVLMLYVPLNNFSVMLAWIPVFLGWTRIKQRINSLAQGYNTASLTLVWLGFIVFACMIKSSLKCTWLYAADVKSSQHFLEKKMRDVQYKPFPCKWQLLSSANNLCKQIWTQIRTDRMSVLI